MTDDDAPDVTGISVVARVRCANCGAVGRWDRDQGGGVVASGSIWADPRWNLSRGAGIYGNPLHACVDGVLGVLEVVGWVWGDGDPRWVRLRVHEGDEDGTEIMRLEPGAETRVLADPSVSQWVREREVPDDGTIYMGLDERGVAQFRQHPLRRGRT